jgi:hypothetical protein
MIRWTSKWDCWLKGFPDGPMPEWFLPCSGILLGSLSNQVVIYQVRALHAVMKHWEVVAGP